MPCSGVRPAVNGCAQSGENPHAPLVLRLARPAATLARPSAGPLSYPRATAATNQPHGAKRSGSNQGRVAGAG
jgi:hypothetical protein